MKQVLKLGTHKVDDLAVATWIPGTHNYGIRYFPTSGVASNGVTPRSRYICFCFFRTSP